MKNTVVAPRYAVVTIDEEGNIVELDRGAEDAFGLRSSEALGRPIAEIIIPRRLAPEYWVRVRKTRSVDPARTAGRRPELPARPGEVSRALADLTIRRTDESHVPALPVPAGAEVESALQALLDCGEEMAQIGSWDWHLETDELVWSDNLYRLYGLEPGEIIPTPRYVVERAHPDDRERVERGLESASRAGRLRPLDYRIVRPDGVVRHLRASEAVVTQADGRRRRLVGSVQDITDRHRAERQIAAHIAVAESLADWQTFEQGATGLLRSLGMALDCVAGVLWLPEGDVLVAHVIWRSGSTDVSGLESVIRQLRLPRGVGLAGQVWETREPLTVAGLEGDPRFSAQAIGVVRGALALPAGHAEEVLAVLEFYSGEKVGAGETERLVRSLAAIGYELGEFLAHRRGELKPSALTPRELEVLQLAADGRSGPDIAARLVVSPATIRRHFEHIYDKYGVSDRAAAVAKALREGLIK